jgi:hypothetical protein
VGVSRPISSPAIGCAQIAAPTTSQPGAPASVAEPPNRSRDHPSSPRPSYLLSAMKRTVYSDLAYNSRHLWYIDLGLCGKNGRPAKAWLLASVH